jgi:hypothetical protein
MEDRWDFELKNLRNWIIHIIFYLVVILAIILL